MSAQVIFTDKASSESKHSSRLALGLRVGISAFGAWMLGIGSIIGSMAWLIHSPMLARAGSVATMTAWLIAGLMSVPLALILMELSSMFPAAGGPYVYKYYALKRLIPGSGELFGFLTGWLFWIAIIVGLACMSNGLVNMLSSVIFGAASASPLWFGPVVILALFGSTTALNLFSVQRCSKINSALTLLKIAMALAFVAIVFTSRHWSLQNIMQFASPSGSTNFAANVSSVLMIALVGFGFLEMVACTSSETVDARKSIPRAMMLTLLSVTAVYIAMCFCVSISSTFSLTADGAGLVASGTKAQATCPGLIGLICGPFWGHVFTACVVASIGGCSFSALMGNARISYTMSTTRLFPSQFAELDAQSRVPRYALWFQFWAVSLIGVGGNLASRSGVFPDAYTFLGETFGFMYAFVVMLYGICVLSLRYTDPEMQRGFRVGKKGNGLLWLLAVPTISLWAYAAFGCIAWPQQVAGAVILLSGAPIYLYYKGRRIEEQDEARALYEPCTGSDRADAA